MALIDMAFVVAMAMNRSSYTYVLALVLVYSSNECTKMTITQRWWGPLNHSLNYELVSSANSTPMLSNLCYPHLNHSLSSSYSEMLYPDMLVIILLRCNLNNSSPPPFTSSGMWNSGLNFLHNRTLVCLITESLPSALRISALLTWGIVTGKI